MLFYPLKSSLKFGLAESLILSGSDLNAPSLRMGIGLADKSVSASLAVGVAPACKSRLAVWRDQHGKENRTSNCFDTASTSRGRLTVPVKFNSTNDSLLFWPNTHRVRPEPHKNTKQVAKQQRRYPRSCWRESSNGYIHYHQANNNSEIVSDHPSPVCGLLAGSGCWRVSKDPLHLVR